MSHSSHDDQNNNPNNERVAVVRQEVRYLTPQEAARERLQQSVDVLTNKVSVQANLEKEPIKMIGGASAVGAVIGLVLGSTLRRSKKIYVDADSPLKYQKALMRAQKKSQNSAGGALLATLGALAFKVVNEQVIQPRLSTLLSDLEVKQKQASGELPRVIEQPNVKPQEPVVPKQRAVHSFLKPVHPGVISMPESQVEAKASGTPIEETERRNPNG